MSRIQRLSPGLINKIAAGEVIERPASVVKEVAENAMDAGATRIDIAIEKGGTELIRVTDNGCGMDADDLVLAVTSHATSKLRSEEDLFSVATMGFRGEAMASIAEISHMTVRSRVNPDVKPTIGEAIRLESAEAVSGAELNIVGGVYEAPVPCGAPAGTCIEVRNLFFNTPVRRKFLRNPSTEFGHITETFQRLALSSPQIHWTLKHNGRMFYDLPATPDRLQRIADIEGKELAGDLLYVEKRFGEIYIHGYVARPNHYRSNPKMQFLFLNGRPIRDRALQHALNEAYRGLLVSNRYPICFLDLEMPLSLVDVNVHPTKMEVRFQDSGIVYGQLLATLREKFLTTNLSTYVGGTPPEESSFTPINETFRNMDEQKGENLSTIPVSPAPSVQKVLEWPQETRKDPPAPPFRPFEDIPRQGTTAYRVARASERSGEGKTEISEEKKEVSAVSSGKNAPPVGTIPQKAIQIHRRYIVTQCEDGMMVIDQHAMHERILYESLKSRMRTMSVEIQRLLVPEPVDLRPTEAAQLLEHRATLESMGILVESFGGNTILVHGLPAILFTFSKGGRVQADELLQEILEFLQNEGNKLTLERFVDHILHTVACKAAVKAGQSLSPMEIEQLLDQYRDCSQADHCPHGRPAVLIWSCHELDKLFCRIV
ncbi:MAG: DNA mismatch repair endonuclease MutL [Planctomycetia bacterium]|nr:DNA mismatch repair endonuclease MutL [Planctomycetia bacterium]